MNRTITASTCFRLLALFMVLSPFVTRSVAQEQQPAIDWQRGPVTGELGSSGKIEVPEGYLFADKKGAQKLLEITHNIPTGNETGVIVPAGEGPENDWFIIFEFSDIGYIKDAAKEKLDADALPESIQNGTEAQNEARKKNGWAPFHVVGWHKTPYYDTHTNNLTWSIRGHSDDGTEDSINHSTRILGRRGTTNVDLVVNPDQAAQAVPKLAALLSKFEYVQGSRYADFIAGDKVAAYGLTALVAGGAGAVLMKTGLLQKFWKLIVLGVIALFGALKKFFARLFGKGETITTATGVDPQG
jgi:uncharacterized membrane-anchored protein